MKRIRQITIFAPYHIKKVISFLFILIFIIMNYTAVKAETYLDLTAQSAILVEQTTGKMLYAKEEHKRMYPASMTKILTALVAVDYLKMDEIIDVGDEINSVPWDSSKAHHFIGESIKVENLLRALLILSGNDSGCVIAMNVARRVQSNSDISYSQAEKIFCDLMNEKAKSLGANESNFINPHGYHSDGHYTTAHDMALISIAYMENDLLRKIAGEVRFEANGAGDDPEPALRTQVYDKDGHNPLLNRDSEHYYPFATGIKTGFTNEASDTLAASAEKDGVKLISVVFYSPEPGRWNDTKKLFDYGFNTYAFETVQTEGEILDNVSIANHKLGEADALEVVASDGHVGFYSKDELLKIQKSIVYEDGYIYKDKEEEDTVARLKLNAPIDDNTVIGKITYVLDGETVFESDILSTREVEERTLSTDVQYYWEQFKSNVFTIKAVPFWLAGVAILVAIIVIISASKRKKERNFYRLRGRY